MWEEINDTIEARRKIIAKLSLKNPDEEDFGETSRKFWRLRRQMDLLYPPEVGACLARIEAGFATYTGHVLMLGRPEVPSLEATEQTVARLEAYMAAGNELLALQTELMNRARPYLQQYGWLEEYGVPARRSLDRSIRAAINTARRVADYLTPARRR